MEKDLDRWNEKKKEVNQAERLIFAEREIWFCHLGVNVGFEQDGVGEKFFRPVIVFRKINDAIFIAIPLTRTPRFGGYYFPIIDSRGISYAMLGQVRTIDARRLSYKSRDMEEGVFRALEERFSQLFQI